MLALKNAVVNYLPPMGANASMPAIPTLCGGGFNGLCAGRKSYLLVVILRANSLRSAGGMCSATAGFRSAHTGNFTRRKLLIQLVATQLGQGFFVHLTELVLS